MNRHIIKLPEIIHSEFVRNLPEGEVCVHGIGTFSVTRFKKQLPSIVAKSNRKKYQMLDTMMTRINFKPDKSLKLAVK